MIHHSNQSQLVYQGSALGLLLFLVFINDLCKCVKYSKVYHFANDNNMLQSDNSLKNVAKWMNFDLKNLSQWLKANKLFLSFTKTESIIFHSSSKKIHHNLKFKLDGKCLTLTRTVKYLGVLLDNHLLCSKQINYVTTTQLKLNQASHWYTKDTQKQYIS